MANGKILYTDNEREALEIGGQKVTNDAAGEGIAGVTFDRELIQLLHAVAHVDLYILGQIVNQHIPLVPQLQGVLVVDARLPDGHVQMSSPSWARPRPGWTA